MRPTTSFAKKKDEDFKTVNISNTEKYLELFYEEDYEKKIKGARAILYLSKDPNCMAELANEYVFNILSRTLKEHHKKNMELLIDLLAFFNGYSFYDTFHEELMGYGIGETCINIIEFQYSKYVIRKEDLIKKHESKDNNFNNELNNFLFMIRKQDRILRLSLNILINLADNPKVEKKMVKKDIIVALQRNLNRSNVNLLVMILLFLKKLSIYNVNKDFMIENDIITKISYLFSLEHALILSLTLEIIYNLSFDLKFVNQILNNKEFFNKVVANFKIQNLRGLVLRILLNISKDQLSKPLFADTDCMYIIYELLIKFPENKIGLELAVLGLNLTSYPKNSDLISDKEKISNLLERAFKFDDCNVIKIVRNIVKFSENEDTNDIFESYIDEFINYIQNKPGNDEFTIELIEILSSIETEWETKIEKFGLIEFIETNLESPVSQGLLIKIIMFIANISANGVSK